MKSTITAILMLFASAAFAATEKIDWKPCEKEIKEFCTTVTDDHEKHECLEEAPKAKISKACSTFNSSLEGKFKEKHAH